MSKQKPDDGYIPIATKVPVWVADLLKILAKMRNMEVYELLQLLVNAFISAAKYNGPVSTEMRLLIDSLKMDAAWNNAFNFASPTATNEIAQMVLILQQPGHNGFGLAQIDRPFFSDTSHITYCVDDILERMLEVSMKGLYQELRDIGNELGSESVRETLTILCDAQRLVNIDRQYQDEGPQMGNFSDYGRAIEYGKRTKRKKHISPDDIQTHIVFGDDDKKAAEMEAQGWEGEHRQTEEPPTNMSNHD
jgi:hypothetical protein